MWVLIYTVIAFGGSKGVSTAAVAFNQPEECEAAGKKIIAEFGQGALGAAYICTKR